MDYCVPRADQLPPLRAEFRRERAVQDQPARRQGLRRARHHRRGAGGGARGARRAATCAHLEMPLTPEKVWRALRREPLAQHNRVLPLRDPRIAGAARAAALRLSRPDRQRAARGEPAAADHRAPDGAGAGAGAGRAAGRSRSRRSRPRRRSRAEAAKPRPRSRAPKRTPEPPVQPEPPPPAPAAARAGAPAPPRRRAARRAAASSTASRGTARQRARSALDEPSRRPATACELIDGARAHDQGQLSAAGARQQLGGRRAARRGRRAPNGAPSITREAQLGLTRSSTGRRVDDRCGRRRRKCRCRRRCAAGSSRSK